MVKAKEEHKDGEALRRVPSVSASGQNQWSDWKGDAARMRDSRLCSTGKEANKSDENSERVTSENGRSSGYVHFHI